MQLGVCLHIQRTHQLLTTNHVLDDVILFFAHDVGEVSAAVAAVGAGVGPREVFLHQLVARTVQRLALARICTSTQSARVGTQRATPHSGAGVYGRMELIYTRLVSLSAIAVFTPTRTVMTHL